MSKNMREIFHSVMEKLIYLEESARPNIEIKIYFCAPEQIEVVWAIGRNSRGFICVYVCVFYRVCTHVRLVIIATNFCVYVCVAVEAIYTFNACNLGK